MIRGILTEPRRIDQNTCDYQDSSREASLAHGTCRAISAFRDEFLVALFVRFPAELPIDQKVDGMIQTNQIFGTGPTARLPFPSFQSKAVHSCKNVQLCMSTKSKSTVNPDMKRLQNCMFPSRAPSSCKSTSPHGSRFIRYQRRFF